MLIDEVSIKVQAGSGGAGKVSFRRNAQTSRGGPDGGNGGNGGNIYFIGVNDISALAQFQFKKILKAEDGVGGGKNNLYGHNAPHLIVKVPVGTEVLDKKSGEKFEISNETDEILVAQGGRGGKGNNEFKTATLQSPRYAENGQRGQEKDLSLTLRISADIGLIGLPNAGKSSILSALTNAQPKIGDYPFTTLEPNLGVLNDLIIADIPGLIEKASEGKGLGSKFLKHIEKTKALIHVVSLENDDPFLAIKTVDNELEAFNKELKNKTRLILLTKKDLFSDEEIQNKVKMVKSTATVLPFSTIDENDIQYLKEQLLKLF